MMRRSLLTLFVVMGAAAPARAQTTEPVTAKTLRPAPSNSLFTLTSNARFTSRNELTCIISEEGICHNVYAVSIPGATWPAGTSDGYFYGSGIQLSGIIHGSADCTADNRRSRKTAECFPWSGDTTSARMWSNSNNYQNYRPLTGIYDSADPTDFSSWPGAGGVPKFPEANAYITDTAIFDASLIGRKSASEQDLWVPLLDNPSGVGGHAHAMGILVELRTLTWSYPLGNEATVFQIYRLTNVTNNAEFQRSAEAATFNGRDSLPDSGWRIDSIYFGYASDPDVGTPGTNQMTAILPFNTQLAYESSFYDTKFDYPSEQFHAPFFGASPGFAGTQLLRTPRNPATGQQRGLTSFSMQDNSLPASTTSQQLWRQASLNVDVTKGDKSCSLTPAQVASLHVCYLTLVKSDARGVLNTGPFSLEPGKSETVIVAAFAAAATQTPLIVPAPTADYPPEIPSVAPGCVRPVNAIEAAAGYVGARTCRGSDPLTMTDLVVVPQSALGKALVAQEIVNAKFLMPSAPVEPVFALTPGDGGIAITWEPSKTERDGDPYYALTWDASKALYDPNYRKFDVEGYRIYRGTSPTNLKLIAQFDLANTALIDNTCTTDSKHVDGAACTARGVRVPIWSGMVQYRNITVSPAGVPRVLRADTLLAAQMRAGTASDLFDTKVPFGFVDSTVQNGFQYFYKVTAFDVNSIRSGPSSMESTGTTKSSSPRAASSAVRTAKFVSGLLGRNGVLPARSRPRIDSITGTFAGPQAPTNGLYGKFNVFSEQLLHPGAVTVRIDSVVPLYYLSGSIAMFHLTIDGRRDSIAIPYTTGSSQQRYDLPDVVIHADSTVRTSLISQHVDPGTVAGSLLTGMLTNVPSFNSVFADWIPKHGTLGFQIGSAVAGGSRWFSGENETMPDPTLGVGRHGRLDGVTTIFQPTPYMADSILNTPSTAPALAPYRIFSGTLSGDAFRHFTSMLQGVTRAADVKFYWGTSIAGQPVVDSVIDVTHDVTVPFSSAVRASYGFVTDADHDGVLTYADFYYLNGLPATPANEVASLLQSKVPLVPKPVMMKVDTNGDLVSDGTGFGLYVDGEPYIFLTPPPASTTWTLRTYNGSVSKLSTTGYIFSSVDGVPAVTGLRYGAIISAAGSVIDFYADLSKVHVVPDPYYGRSLFDTGPQSREIQFVNLPPRAIVRIYTLSGVLVHTMKHDDPTGGGKQSWDMRTPSGKLVASGVYYFHIATPDGRTSVGKFTVISAPNQ